MATTWASWGDLTVDCGREMYVPWMLSEGKMLYRDVWYLYGPAAPYFNSVLYRIFGVHLEVLYIAGSLAALGSAIFLYLSGLRLSSWLAGWTAAAVVIVQAFEPGLFGFPLPYSFASVYGCLVSCLFLWLILRAVNSSGRAWMFAAACAAAVGLLLKLEFGAACYVALGIAMGLRAWRHRSWGNFGKDLATALPGVLMVAGVVWWMISIRGVDFLIEGNLETWPTSYFMRTYGKAWLANTGLEVTGSALMAAVVRAVFFSLWILTAYRLLSWRDWSLRASLYRILLLVTLGAWIGRLPDQKMDGILLLLFVPRDMVLYSAVAAGVACWYYFQGSREGNEAKLVVLFAFASLVAIRILLKTFPSMYPIYYDGPAVLSYLTLVILGIRHFVAQSDRRRLCQWLVCGGCLAAVTMHALAREAPADDLATLKTERGSIRVLKSKAERYEKALEFIKEKGKLGETFLSVPEDTSLYFLSGTQCPVRVFAFTPGIVVPGKMTDDVIRELDMAAPRYLLWSNRSFPEYGVPIFGRDFDRRLGDYLKANYQKVGPLTATNDVREWQITVWERNTAGERR